LLRLLLVPLLQLLRFRRAGILPGLLLMFLILRAAGVSASPGSACV
jgi:hypothetical protein